MPLKKTFFFDYNSCTQNPIKPGISFDNSRNDTFFQLELSILKKDLSFQKLDLGFMVPHNLPQNVYDELPEMLDYNMELFGIGNTTHEDFTEYLLFFKPWYLDWQEQEEYLNYLENFIYIIPYRILKSLLSHGIRLKNFTFNDLKNIRVISSLNESFFDDLYRNWENMSKQPIPYMGVGLAQKIHNETGNITLNSEYNISENQRYLFDPISSL